MQFSVKGKQIDIGSALREYVETKLSELIGKYFADSIESIVTFSREAHLFHVEVSVHAKGILLQTTAEATEPYPAFDQAADRLSKRLRRYKNKLRAHHHETRRGMDQEFVAASFVLRSEDSDREEEANDNPTIVAEMTTPVETLTVSDAVMRLDLGDLPALLFRNSSHGGLNMIYRRPDGHIGWVDPTAKSAMAGEKSKAALGV